MGFRDRPRKGARSGPRLDVRPRILIVTEGEVTEPEYLRGFVRACRHPLVDIEVVKGPGTPRNRVETAKARMDAAKARAKAQKDANLAYDAVWCVFDVNEHPYLSEAKDIAASNGIELAISNPCFELWLLLHVRESPGCQHRHEMQRRVGTVVPGYDKAVSYGDFAEGYENAVKRARRLDEDAAEMGEPGRCPTTGVYRLTEAIRGS